MWWAVGPTRRPRTFKKAAEAGSEAAAAGAEAPKLATRPPKLDRCRRDRCCRGSRRGHLEGAAAAATAAAEAAATRSGQGSDRSRQGRYRSRQGSGRAEARVARFVCEVAHRPAPVGLPSALAFLEAQSAQNRLRRIVLSCSVITPGALANEPSAPPAPAPAGYELHVSRAGPASSIGRSGSGARGAQGECASPTRRSARHDHAADEGRARRRLATGPHLD